MEKCLTFLLFRACQSGRSNCSIELCITQPPTEERDALYGGILVPCDII